jgi:phosphatidate cytidylyltransferase
MSPLASRVLFGLPLAAVAIFAVVRGGWLMTGLGLVAGVIATHEFCRMTRSLRPLAPAAFAGVVALIVTIHVGGLVWSLAPLLATLLVAFWLSVVAEVRQTAIVQIAVTLFGVVWIGYGIGFLIAIRDIDQPSPWSTWLVLAVLLGVWASDIFAYLGGRVFGRRKLARVISPNKTIEGLLIGLLFGTAVGFVALYNQPGSDPISPADAALIAFSVAVVAPVGDLFESYLKRDAGIKDTGRVLGGHGGVLDRIDALLFAGTVAYFVALALGRA